MSYTRDTVNDLIYDEDSGEYEPIPVPSNPIVKELEANDTVYDIIGKGIVNNNSSTPLKMWSGTRAEYNAIATKNPDTIYHITDDNNITQTLLETLYPVGAIYIGTMNACPLSVLFGTWEKVSSGRVLQGADENHNPGTTIDAGLPNLSSDNSQISVVPSADSTSWDGKAGMFYDNGSIDGYGGMSDTSGSWYRHFMKVDASRQNSIYGNSDTVQPPAFVVNIWKRTA